MFSLRESDTERRLRALESRLRALESREYTPLSGSWTPTLTAASGGATYTYANRAGYYVRVGSLVVIQGYIALSGVTGIPSGALSITGLPFTSRNQTLQRGGVMVYNWDFIDLSANYTAVSGLIVGGGTTILLREAGDNVAGQSVNAAALSVALTAFDFTGVYEAA